MSQLELQGRTAVITGASRGLGAGLAEDFARRGMRLALCARQQPTGPDSDDVLRESVDVTDAGAMSRFASEVEARFGCIDLWINNAGVLEPVAPLRDVDVSAFRRHIDVNLTGVFLGTQLYVQHVRRRGGEGVLINVSSGAAWSAYAGWSVYCAGKAGVERLTECVHEEESDTGLRAYSVAPGVIDTEMQALIRKCSPEQFPSVDRFLERKRDDSFNSVGFVAEHLLAIAFDPDRRPDEVAIRLPDEKS